MQRKVCGKTEAKASVSDWQRCLWPTFFSKSHTAYFSVLIFIAVSNISSSSMHLKHGALCNKFVSLGIERQFLKMETVWYGSISSRFSVMLSSTLFFDCKCRGANSWCRGDPSNCWCLGSGIEKDENWSWKRLLVWGLLSFVWLRSNLHLELDIFKLIHS